MCGLPIDIYHRAFGAVRQLYPVALAERALDRDRDAGEEIGDEVLQGETDDTDHHTG